MKVLTFPLYLEAYNNGRLREIITSLESQLKHCQLCPRECKVNRYNSTGTCGQSAFAKISAAVLHFGEEPPLVGKGGAGAVFFSGCSMKCVYCQNFGFSQMNRGKEISAEELGEQFLKIQESGGETLDLVTPTPHLPHILKALEYAIEKGFELPIVYNTSGYEKLETIKSLEGIVDIYLADIRYTSDDLGKKYSGVPDYWTVTRKSIKEMFRQVGAFKKRERFQRGLVIRHLVLPEKISGTEKMLDFLAFELSLSVPISLMSQYKPVYKASEYSELARKITPDEYNYALTLLEDYGFDGWMQHFEEKEEFRVKPLSEEL